MTFFFLVVGLEARREFDVGEFRERPRVVLPVLAGVGGMIGAVGIFLAVNAGRPSVHGWGAAMSTDTAFALGVLALLGGRAPERLRGFILTLTVVDDIVGLVVIATVYTRHLRSHGPARRRRLALSPSRRPSASATASSTWRSASAAGWPSSSRASTRS